MSKLVKAWKLTNPDGSYCWFVTASDADCLTVGEDTRFTEEETAAMEPLGPKSRIERSGWVMECHMVQQKLLDAMPEFECW